MRALPLLLILGCHGDKPASTDDSAPSWGLPSRPSNPTCTAPARPISTASVALEQVYGALSFSQLVGLVPYPDGEWWYALEKGGTLSVFDADLDVTVKTTALDLTDDVVVSSESGLLGFALHPDFEINGYAYVSYTPSDGEGLFDSRVSRFTSTDGGLSFDKSSEKVIFQVDQPYSNHNGGHLTFGPDGLLYFGLGDGGSAGDPLGNGQDTTEVLGSILRLDVDGGDPYAIPADNPFADGSGAEEIYAWGLRNPWRFTFDTETGELWAGDVGQDEWEEVDLIELGGNYGWNTMEGAHCYKASTCDEAGLRLPIAEYAHDGDKKSITGGFVYRGTAIPELVGTYLYTDYYPGPLTALTYDPLTGAADPTDLIDNTGFAVSSFAQDTHGELYLLAYSDGAIYQIVPNDVDTAAVDPFPQTLSETGCVDPSDPRTPAEGMIPYTVRSPLWSDGLDKERYLAIPDGETIAVGADGDWELPIGSVVMKTFLDGDDPVETRLLVRHDDGGWAGYSYAWDGEDAFLLPAGSARDLGDHTWEYPSRAGCLSCHTSAVGQTLGLETAQLNGDLTYPNGVTGNQIATLDHIGLLSTSPGDPAALDALPEPGGADDAEARARSLLHSNCAFCHLPGGTGLGDLDLRYSTALADAGLCDVAPQNGDLGVADARIVAPGAPERSVLSLRMYALDVSRMPPLGSSVVDADGAALIDGWISAMSACP